MPITYEFQCEQCQEVFSAESIAAIEMKGYKIPKFHPDKYYAPNKTIIKCPECNSDEVAKIFGAIPFYFKK